MIEYLDIGKVVNTHGLKGEVKVMPLTDNPERYNLLKSIIINENKFEIEYARYHKGLVFLKLKGIDNIDKAETLRNTIIKINRKDAVKLPEGSYFICDIIGITVYDEFGSELGMLRDVLQTGSNDVYIVKKENKEMLIPALKAVVKSIDIQSKKMVVNLPEGTPEYEV